MPARRDRGARAVERSSKLVHSGGDRERPRMMRRLLRPAHTRWRSACVCISFSLSPFISFAVEFPAGQDVNHDTTRRGRNASGGEKSSPRTQAPRPRSCVGCVERVQAPRPGGAGAGEDAGSSTFLTAEFAAFNLQAEREARWFLGSLTPPSLPSEHVCVCVCVPLPRPRLRPRSVVGRPRPTLKVIERLRCASTCTPSPPAPDDAPLEPTRRSRRPSRLRASPTHLTCPPTQSLPFCRARSRGSCEHMVRPSGDGSSVLERYAPSVCWYVALQAAFALRLRPLQAGCPASSGGGQVTRGRGSAGFSPRRGGEPRLNSRH